MFLCVKHAYLGYTFICVGVKISKLHMKHTKSVQVLIKKNKLTISILQRWGLAMDLEEMVRASGVAEVEE